MQHKITKSLTWLPGLIGGLLIWLAAGAVWAEEPSSAADEPESNIEGWYEEDEKGESPWTWFGFGYENRMSLSASSSGASVGSGGAGAAAVGAGSAAQIMKQRRSGRR
jgi:hypothetical protein